MRSLVWSAFLCSLLGVGVIGSPATTFAREAQGASKAAPVKREQKKDNKKPVNKMCPVEPEHEADPTVTTTHKGKLIGLCCQDCIKTFTANPEKYVKKMK